MTHPTNKVIFMCSSSQIYLLRNLKNASLHPPGIIMLHPTLSHVNLRSHTGYLAQLLTTTSNECFTTISQLMLAQLFILALTMNVR